MGLRSDAAVVFGAFCTAMSLELFYIPHRFIDGGMTGLAVVVGRAVNMVPVHVLVLLDAACIWAGFRTLGAAFVYRSATAILTMSVVLALVSPLDPLFHPTVAAIVGGAGVGLGASLVIGAGAAMDGGEVLGLLLQSQRGFPVPWFMFLFNAFVFSIVAFRYGWADSAYSILAQGTGLIVISILLRNGR